jgi:hypothetical protein
MVVRGFGVRHPAKSGSGMHRRPLFDVMTNGFGAMPDYQAQILNDGMIAAYV